MKTIVALFDNLSDAQEVVADLVDSGFSRDDISLVARDRTGEYSSYFEDDTTSDVAETTATGAIAGGAIGGLAGLLVGLGAFAIPGIGPVVAAGPIVAGLTGAGIGAAAGGIFGALVGWGVPEAEAEVYAEAVRRGGTIVAVRTPENQVERVTRIMNQYGPVDIERRSDYWREQGWTGYDPESEPYTADQINREYSQYDVYDQRGSYGTFDTYRDSFRGHYDTTYAGRGYAFTNYEPAYRHGYDLATDERYRERDWSEVEPEARRRWETEHEGAWEEFKDSVRHAWEEVKDAFSSDDYEEERGYYDEGYDTTRRPRG